MFLVPPSGTAYASFVALVLWDLVLPEKDGLGGAGGKANLPALMCSHIPLGLRGCCQHRPLKGCWSFFPDFCAHSVWATLRPQGRQMTQGTPDEP